MNITTLEVKNENTRKSASKSYPLTRDDITGNFSLLENRPMVIDTTPGLILHVRSGLVQICHPEGDGQQLVQGGQSFVLDRTGPVGLAAIVRGEVRLEWPAAATKPIPVPSEPSELYAYA